MKVVLTGGAGYLGIELAYALACNPAVSEVLLFDSFTRSSHNILVGMRKFTSGVVSFCEGDILDRRALSDSLRGAHVVVHLAAQTPTFRGEVLAQHFDQINNWGSSAVVDAISEIESISTVINVSTLQVYGPGELTEISSAPRPSTFYAVSKLKGERHFDRLAFTKPVMVYNVRAPVLYGYSKNLRMDSPMNRLIFDAYLNKKVVLHGGGDLNWPQQSVSYMVTYLAGLVTGESQISHSSGDGSAQVLVPSAFNLNVSTVFELLSAAMPGVEAVFLDQYERFSGLLMKQGEGLNVLTDLSRLEQDISDLCASITI